MAVQLKSSQEFDKVHGAKILAYGRAGMGKTIICATAPAPVILSAESGLLCLTEKNLIRVYGENNPTVSYNMPVIEIYSLVDLTEAYEWCKNSSESKQFQTVCLDSLTEIGEKVLSNAKKTVKDGRQAYGELMEKMTDTIKKFRDLSGKHIYMSAKQEFIKDSATGITSFQPMMPGNKLAPQVPYLYDLVCNLNIGKLEDGSEYRYLRTQPDLQYEAKDRSGALDPIEKPDLTHIINRITGDT